jgi:hypothetical protein
MSRGIKSLSLCCSSAPTRSGWVTAASHRAVVVRGAAHPLEARADSREQKESCDQMKGNAAKFVAQSLAAQNKLRS